MLQRIFPTPLHVEVDNDKIRRVLFSSGQVVEGVWALDWSGISPFARLVYEALMDLGVGETATYGAIAQRIGHPKAARAVGSACNKNPFPVIVPCHRVVAKGSLGGFAYGSTLKQQLLAFERGSGDTCEIVDPE